MNIHRVHHFAVTRKLAIFIVRMSVHYFLAVLGMAALAYCKKDGPPGQPVPLFDSIPVVKPLIPSIAEISGIADSKINPGYIWGEEDSGNPPRLFLVGHGGQVAKSVYLKGIVNRDWEELALSNGDIYLAETGDNNQVYGSYKFYLFTEPSYSTDTVYQIETISFSYPDGSHDSEAFLVDPVNKDIYIITKRDNPSRVYKLAYPYTSGVASYEGNLDYTAVVGATISGDGKEIIVKTYGALRYYSRSSGQSITDALKASFTLLPYQPEPQGEAVCFAADGSGYYTLSEQLGGTGTRLYFYKRN